MRFHRAMLSKPCENPMRGMMMLWHVPVQTVALCEIRSHTKPYAFQSPTKALTRPYQSLTSTKALPRPYHAKNELKMPVLCMVVPW